MNLNDLVEFANATTEKIFDKFGTVHPLYFMINADDEHFIVPVGRFVGLLPRPQGAPLQ